MATALQEPGPGLWTWQARHPEWHPGEFGRLVRSWAVEVAGGVVLVDPLLPADGAGTVEALDAAVAGRAVTIAITIPYHVRSSAELSARFGGATVLGHRRSASRLDASVPFRAIAPGDALPHGMQVVPIGSPRRAEQPLWIPERRALALGDAIVGAEGGLRVWIQHKLTPARERWFSQRLAPTLRPLIDLGPDAVLVTHGPPVLAGATAALAEALEAGPWRP
jgi:glyoxylase-like metal-dependent hydrolase (beta-lactamase superfamily II)